MFSVSSVIHLFAFFSFVGLGLALIFIKKQKDLLRTLVTIKKNKRLHLEDPFSFIKKFCSALNLEFEILNEAKEKASIGPQRLQVNIMGEFISKYEINKIYYKGLSKRKEPKAVEIKPEFVIEVLNADSEHNLNTWSEKLSKALSSKICIKNIK